MESIQTAFARGMSCAPQRLVFDVAAPHSLALQPGFSEVMQWFKGKAVMETRKKASGCQEEAMLLPHSPIEWLPSGLQAHQGQYSFCFLEILGRLDYAGAALHENDAAEERKFEIIASLLVACWRTRMEPHTIGSVSKRSPCKTFPDVAEPRSLWARSGPLPGVQSTSHPRLPREGRTACRLPQSCRGKLTCRRYFSEPGLSSGGLPISKRRSARA